MKQRNIKLDSAGFQFQSKSRPHSSLVRTRPQSSFGTDQKLNDTQKQQVQTILFQQKQPSSQYVIEQSLQDFIYQELTIMKLNKDSQRVFNKIYHIDHQKHEQSYEIKDFINVKEPSDLRILQSQTCLEIRIPLAPKLKSNLDIKEAIPSLKSFSKQQMYSFNPESTPQIINCLQLFVYYAVPYESIIDAIRLIWKICESDLQKYCERSFPDFQTTEHQSAKYWLKNFIRNNNDFSKLVYLISSEVGFPELRIVNSGFNSCDCNFSICKLIMFLDKLIELVVLTFIHDYKFQFVINQRTGLFYRQQDKLIAEKPLIGDISNYCICIFPAIVTDSGLIFLQMQWRYQ